VTTSSRRQQALFSGDLGAAREIFDRVIRDLDETAVGSKLVIGVRELSRAIRDDMEHEERELLSEP